MGIWQVSCKETAGGKMLLREFRTWWRALLWVAGNIRKQKITVIVRITE